MDEPKVICPRCHKKVFRVFPGYDCCYWCQIQDDPRAPAFREVICAGVSKGEPITKAAKKQAESESYAERWIDSEGGINVTPISEKAYSRTTVLMG